MKEEDKYNTYCEIKMIPEEQREDQKEAIKATIGFKIFSSHYDLNELKKEIRSHLPRPLKFMVKTE